MGVTITVARFSTPTSTGNVTWTDTSLGGLTPKAIMVIANHADTDGTAEDELVYGLGFADDTREGTAGIQCQHGVTTTNNDKRARDAQVISTIYQSTTEQVVATFVSFQADSVTLNFTTVDTDAQLYTVVFFAGTDLSAYHNNFVPDTLNTEQDITGPGFEPDIVFFSYSGVNGGATSQATMSYGVAVNDGTPTQKCIAFNHGTGLGTSAPHQIIYSNRAWAEVTTLGGVFINGEISNFDSSGFSSTTRLNNGRGRCGYLALNFGGVASAVLQSFDSPTSTGNDVRTGLGIEPVFVMLGMTDLQSEDSVVSNSDAGSFGISTFTADDEFSNAWADEDNQTTTDTQSLSDNQAVNFASGDGTTQYAATFVSLDSDGHTLNYSTADGTARKWFEVAIGTASGNEVSAAAIAGGLNVLRKAPLLSYSDLAGAAAIARIQVPLIRASIAASLTNIHRTQRFTKASTAGGLPNAVRAAQAIAAATVGAALTTLSKKINLNREQVAGGLSRKVIKSFEAAAATAGGLAQATATTVTITLQSAAATAGAIVDVVVTYLQFFPPFTGSGGFGARPEGRRRWASWRGTWRRKTGRTR